MQRERLVPRPGWPAQMAAIGFDYHSIGGTYWDESRCYRFTAAQVDTLEQVVDELHDMALVAARHVVAAGQLDRFAIPQAWWPTIAQSLRDHDAGTAAGFALLGRMDLSYDGVHPPRLLEYNADTPSALLEASVAQWLWQQERQPHADQFNSIHERLIAAWSRLRTLHDGGDAGPLHFAACREAVEDWGNLEYLRDTARQGGWQTRTLDVEDVGHDGTRFVDLDGQPIGTLVKAYPWEWLVREDFGPRLLAGAMRCVEPAWKMLLSNKAILVVLWELFPGHPNLLPAAFDRAALGDRHVAKPLLSREGANVTLFDGAVAVATPGDYGAEGFVYQALAPLPRFGDDHALVGAWVVDGRAAGIGLREDDTPVTRDTSRFVPHYVAG